MKKFFTKATLAVSALGISVSAFAGNRDRTGQAGAMELTINPWAQSSGLFGMDGAVVGGIQAMKNNIAGLSQMGGNTEVGFAYTMFLRDSKIGVNNLGVAQKLGETGTVGINIMSMSYGDIPVTTYGAPEPTGSTFRPQMFNVSVGYAKDFSKYIRAGVGVTLVSEQISNISATGACFDAGVQYVTGKRDNFHFGVTLRNIGTNMRFTGQGFTVNAQAPNSIYDMNQQTPSEKFEMPTSLNISLGYDFYLDTAYGTNKPKHRITAVGTFQSNSFNNDYLGAGVEYGFMNMVMLRAAYRYEKNIGDASQSGTFYTGLAAGATVQKMVGNNMLSIDYAYRPTARPNNGVHTFSVRFGFGYAKDKKSNAENGNGSNN